MHRFLRRTGSAAAVALGLVFGSTAGNAEPVKGGVLNIAMFPEPPMIVSAFNSSTYVGMVSTKIFDGLVTYDFDITPKPMLATSWEVAPDGLAYTFNLREGVTWHDGKPFTAADVKFSLEKVWREMHPRGRTTFQHVSTVETPDSHTVVIKLNKPTPILLKALSSYESQVIPAHIFDDGTEIAKHPGLNKPIGTGPFMFKEWKKGNYIQVERNPNYWDSPKPYLDQIVWRIIPDGAARSAAMETGETHYSAFSSVPLPDIQRLDELPTIDTETRGYEYLSPVFLMEMNTRNEHLKKREVRQAISHAINRKFLIDNVWFGYGGTLAGPVPPTHVDFYTTDLPDTVSYDPEKAKRLLDSAGYKPDADGKRLKLRLEVAAINESFVLSGEYLKQALGKVGIDVQLRNIDLGGFIKRMYTDNDFDMSMNIFYAMPDPTIGVQRLYWSKNIKKGVPFSNASGYSNAEMDRVLEAAQTENDLGKRKALFHEMQRMAARDVPVIDLLHVKSVTVFNKRVKNHTTGAEGPFENFAKVYLTK